MRISKDTVRLGGQIPKQHMSPLMEKKASGAYSLASLKFIQREYLFDQPTWPTLSYNNYII